MLWAADEFKLMVNLQCSRAPRAQHCCCATMSGTRAVSSSMFSVY